MSTRSKSSNAIVGEIFAGVLLAQGLPATNDLGGVFQLDLVVIIGQQFLQGRAVQIAQTHGRQGPPGGHEILPADRAAQRHQPPMGEIDDPQQTKNDCKAKREQRVEGPVAHAERHELQIEQQVVHVAPEFDEYSMM